MEVLPSGEQRQVAAQCVLCEYLGRRVQDCYTLTNYSTSNLNRHHNHEADHDIDLARYREWVKGQGDRFDRLPFHVRGLEALRVYYTDVVGSHPEGAVFTPASDTFTVPVSIADFVRRNYCDSHNEAGVGDCLTPHFDDAGNVDRYTLRFPENTAPDFTIDTAKNGLSFSQIGSVGAYVHAKYKVADLAGLDRNVASSTVRAVVLKNLTLLQTLLSDALAYSVACDGPTATRSTPSTTAPPSTHGSGCTTPCAGSSSGGTNFWMTADSVLRADGGSRGVDEEEESEDEEAEEEDDDDDAEDAEQDDEDDEDGSIIDCDEEDLDHDVEAPTAAPKTRRPKFDVRHHRR
eukprot:GHVU01038696.1.p2 GENE.GHVU01038696.1~~GHVU01038696.1.p2  ORF type:complete len:347 (-),score=58.19 GHVU01038696.1:1302-2342(-)